MSYTRPNNNINPPKNNMQSKSKVINKSVNNP